MNPRQAAVYYLEEKAFGRAELLLREWVLAYPDDVYAHMELIWCFYKRSTNYDRWKDCDQFFEQIYNRPNAQVIGHFVRAEQLVYEDREEESLVYYKVAIDEGLNVPAVHYSFGVAMEMLGRNTEAKAEYEIAIDQDPRFLPALEVYGRMLFKEGRFNRVEAMLQTLDGLEPRSLEYQFRDALEDLESLDRLGKACVALRRSIELLYQDQTHSAAMTLWPVFCEHSDNCWFVRTMVYLFYRANWLHVGKRRLEDVLDEDSPMLSYARGLMFWCEGKYEKALAGYDKAIEKRADHPLVHCTRALVYEKLGRVEEEERDLVAAYERQPWLAYVRAEMAYNVMERSKYDKVLELADLSREDRECALNYDVSGHTSLAALDRLALRALMSQGMLTGAVQRATGDSAPIWDEDLLFTRAMVYTEAGMFQLAAEELSAAIDVDDGVVGRISDGDEKRLEVVAEHSPGSFAPAFAQALRAEYGEELDEAIKLLRELAGQHPKEARIWYHIANISHLLKDVATTMEACRKAISCDSSHRDSVRLLCTVLHEQQDLSGLLALGDELGGQTLPLEFALELSRKKQKDELSHDIAERLLRRDATHTGALLHFLSGAGPETVEYARLTRKLAQSAPFDFEMRAFAACRLLLRGSPRDSAADYKTLLADGCTSVSTVLMSGLSEISARREKPEAQGDGFETFGKQAAAEIPDHHIPGRPSSDQRVRIIKFPGRQHREPKGSVEAADVSESDSDKHTICKLWLIGRWADCSRDAYAQGERQIDKAAKLIMNLDEHKFRKLVTFVTSSKFSRFSHAFVSTVVKAYSVKQLFGTFETISIREFKAKPAFATAMLQQLEAIILFVADDRPKDTELHDKVEKLLVHLRLDADV